MIDPIQKYFKVGTIQWMSFPGGGDTVINSIRRIARDEYFDAIEITKFAIRYDTNASKIGINICLEIVQLGKNQ